MFIRLADSCIKGEVLRIIDQDDNAGMFKISIRTIDGVKEGWLEYRYVCRELLDPDDDESEE